MNYRKRMTYGQWWEQMFNDDLEAYAEKSIKNWRGLKAKHLPLLFPADISAMDPEENIEYDDEDALELLKNSTIFDQFITDCMNDYEQFSKQKAEEDEKN